MGWFDQIFQCWPLSTTCAVDWDGWVVFFAAMGFVVAIVGTIGTWAAAAATFFAVYVPYRAQVRANQQESEQAEADGELQIIKFIPKTFSIYQKLGRIPTELRNSDVAIDTVTMDKLISQFSSLRFPDLPRHRQLLDMRRVAGVLEISIEMLSDYVGVDWTPALRRAFADLLEQVESALIAFVERADIQIPEMKFRDDFPRHFRADPVKG